MNLGACGRLGTKAESGTWFRAIQPAYWTTSLRTSHTRSTPGRFNAGSSATPLFPVLYLSENHVVALFEARAVFGSTVAPPGIIPHPKAAYVTLNVSLNLSQVTDLTTAASQAALATTAQELTGDWHGYQQRSPLTSVTQPTGLAPTHELGAALHAVAGLEGFVTLSAKLPTYKNLVECYLL